VALSRLGPLRARSGDRGGALDALRESVVLSSGVRDHIALGASICLAVVTFGTLGRNEPVAVLSGAWNSGAVVGNVSRREREEEAKASNQARVVLGDARADELGLQGASMTYDEIVAYLLSVVDELIAEDGDD
jgi:hypothetical protein